MRYLRPTLALAALAVMAACQDRDPAGPEQAPRPADGAGPEFQAGGEWRTGYMIGRDGKPMKISFQVRDGTAFYQGDIDLGPAERVPTTAEHALRLYREEGPRKGGIIEGYNYRWPKGIVPYVIASNLPSQYRVHDAIAHIEANTDGVDFVPRTNQADFVYIYPGSGCSSPVGKRGGQQNISLASGCTTGNTIHELNHSLGMWHEQSRCDRNAYVEILWGNILAGKENNFYQECTGSRDVDAYNEGSIMHYPPDAFTKNGQPTIRSLRGLDYLMGQRSGLAGTDIVTINWMYPLPYSGPFMAISPYAPGAAFGGFQSVSGTGAQTTITVDFFYSTGAVTVTGLDPDYSENYLVAYNSAGTEIKRQRFGYDSAPGVFTSSTVTVYASGITRARLIPDSRDYIAYDNLYTTTPYVPGAAFGGFQSTAGTGVQSTITLRLAHPATSVSVTALDPDFSENWIVAYNSAGVEVDRQRFDYDGYGWSYTESTKTVSGSDIVRVALIPDPGDYVAWNHVTITR